MNLKTAPPRAASTSLYERDFYSWAMEQARLVRERRFAALDIENIAKELETLGRSEARELQSRLRVLLVHLLKWRYQPDRRSRIWRLSIRGAREEIEEHLADDPGLKPRAPELFVRAYRLARVWAAEETDLEPEVFPPDCPFTLVEATDPEFWPERG